MKQEKPLSELKEKLADLEHYQWATWTEYMINNWTKENIERWERQLRTPYSELSEKEKESDREWADRVLKIVNEWKKQFIKEILDEIEKDISYQKTYLAGDFERDKPINWRIEGLKRIKEIIKQKAGKELAYLCLCLCLNFLILITIISQF